MRRRGALVLAAALAGPVAARAQAADSVAPRGAAALPADRWLGGDKAKHFFLAGFTYATSFAGARLAGLDRRPALAASAAPVVVVSIGKELRDRRATGRFSFKDLVADAAGAAAYAALLSRTAR